MPLNTQIVRDGENLRLPNGWGHFHVVCITLASVWDRPENPGPFTGDGNDGPEFIFGESENVPEEWRGKTGEDYPEVPCPIGPSNVAGLVGYHVLGATPLNDGEYTLTREHAFVDTTDSEVLRLLPGDVLRAWRN